MKNSLKQIAYDTVKKKIMNCEYGPNEFLNEDTLCAELGMSRTPVRDALGRLEQDHLITILPKKGFIVAPLSISIVNNVFEGRILLEPHIIRNYCQELSKETLSHMQEILVREYAGLEKKMPEIFEIDSAFHDCMISQCTNSYLQRLHTDLQNQNSRLRVISGRASRQRISQTYEEHFRIFQALEQHQAEKAAQLMVEHLLNSKEASYQSLFNGNISLR